ncbi:MAG: NusG domain II-containing protein [Peptococcaceae bacterium]|jgi:hypothetical protein|nr:NusG domain II-containing protein [Peptococcaceae bacterium]
MKKGDGGILLVIVALALLLLGQQRLIGGQSGAGLRLEISGPAGERWVITEGEWLAGGGSRTLAGPAGGLTLVYGPEGVYVMAAGCPDQNCVQAGVIHRAGQSLVCAPNRISARLLRGGGAAEGELDGVLR